MFKGLKGKQKAEDPSEDPLVPSPLPCRLLMRWSRVKYLSSSLGQDFLHVQGPE